ncbi:geranylgeranyl transferase type-2 subunit alpha 1 [Impatiens glandulifera]|uniref:geranylgeranyl transferase type-2 subunit alpha 1 n=1 Tax=Impatiens glandulifera TaxID=253017 RepID=UPI001FB13E3C|nr:geranylgeranyl transferase type-2 subunit alpha 1 [Impatiens glandulifera]
MHGRPRKAPSPEEEKSYALKASKLRPLQSQILHFHHDKIYTKEALEINSKLLEANPEYLTAWNYRRLAVEFLLSQPESQTETESTSIINEELKVTERALSKNFKSYGAWYHRKWVLSKGQSSIDRELQLLGVFLKKDSRNFHAWNYRRFVAALKKRSDEEELQFTTDMINDNFSNYSAWHNRSVLLARLLETRAQGFFPREKVLTEEYDLVHQAIFTDPDDQSGWFYHLWLLSQTFKGDNPLLISTWPPNESRISLSADGYRLITAPPSVDFHLCTTTIPLVLSFTEVVQGVNSSSVIVESEYDSNEDVIWKPLSTDSSLGAQVWVAHLNFPEEKNQPLQPYEIKVSIGHSSGITSSSGIHLCEPSQFKFTVTVNCHTSVDTEGSFWRLDSWGNEHFHLLQTNLFGLPRIQNEIALTDHNWKLESIETETALFRELLSETNCKIGKLTLARLLLAHDTMMYSNRDSSDSKSIQADETLQIYNDLISMDPSHSEYYKEEYSLVLLQQMTSSHESLLKRSYCYKGPTSSGFDNATCLRLNNLKLSRIGSVDRLLWVQMLDLSDNQLRSIDGLESMQLLSCLNLANNKIASFSALEPLKMLNKSLKVVNVSNNEIGAHSINSRRYLCASPFSHTVGSDWNLSEFITNSAEKTTYWEAFALLKDLKLTQLDINGNPIDNEKFNSFLVKILPSLKWLDNLDLQ